MPAGSAEGNMGLSGAYMVRNAGDLPMLNTTIMVKRLEKRG